MMSSRKQPRLSRDQRYANRQLSTTPSQQGVSQGTAPPTTAASGGKKFKNKSLPGVATAAEGGGGHPSAGGNGGMDTRNDNGSQSSNGRGGGGGDAGRDNKRKRVTEGKKTPSADMEVDTPELSEEQKQKIIADATKAQQLATKRAKAATASAATELADKKRCLERERSLRKTRAPTTVADLTKYTPRTPSDPVSIVIPLVKSGWYVNVEPRTSPGFNNPGGWGWIREYPTKPPSGDGGVRGLGDDTECDVWFQCGTGRGRWERGVSHSRITMGSVPGVPGVLQRLAVRKGRDILPPSGLQQQRAAAAATAAGPPTTVSTGGAMSNKSLIVTLKDGHSRGLGSGWLRRQIAGRAAWDKAVRENKGAVPRLNEREVQRFIQHRRMLDEVLHVLKTLGHSPNMHNKQGGGGFAKRKTVHNPMSQKYLALAWGVGVNRGLNEVKESLALPVFGPPPPPKKYVSVITDRDFARRMYTPARMYALAKRQEEMLREWNKWTPAQAQAKLTKFTTAYEKESRHVKARFEIEARNHDSQQPMILMHILRVLHQDPTEGFDGVAAQIGNWCSGDTIAALFRSLKYNNYSERILPLQTAPHKKNQVRTTTFAHFYVPVRESLCVFY